ncbi:glycosyltransferase family 2 protein [Enterococcus gilvus]|uniref:glycosyltransferase family 2 protein n=1 Tax=Enterococcus gilvus TaxID=160453 RepID=UPI002906A7DA|nr:glycosyltransferase family 2 protein [Enterococcus gilvus]MDU5509058.1 glycosyltransferase family 2 protein [Enterococcus gilvus]
MIDIIIPIYSGERETIECIESVLKSQNSQEYRIIAINDCTPSKEIRQYLIRKYKNQKILLIENKENLGFVKTINIGLKYSQNDVIILNSDTIVFDKLVNILSAIAYKEKKIGTVTALTNNGTIVSLPEYNLDNSISIEQAKKINNYLSSKFLDDYEIIPTGVGHCMFIKRSLLNKIGLFDERLFDKGYGEENDFSLRAKKMGYINVVSLGTFIYHYGGTSFGNDKKKLIKKHKAILNKKYPMYRFKVRIFNLKNNKVKKISKILKRNTKETYPGELYE